jgi:hypothetical protein
MSKQYSLNLNIPLYDSAEVVIVGGGPSGIAAAISAARCCKSVILIEKTGQLGGMSTLANVSIFMAVGNITGIYREIMSELMPESLVNADPNKYYPQFNSFLFRYYFSEKLEKEKVKVILHADFVSAVKNNNKVEGVVINTREGLKVIEGNVVIDCTGDGRVAIDAGASYTSGRKEDGLTQPMTLMFQMQNTGKPVKQILPEGCYYYVKKGDLPQGRHLYWEDNQDGTLLVNMTRVKGNGASIEDSNYVEREALKQVFSVANYLQRNGFENYVLSHIGAQTGARETNQIIGLYVLNEEDLYNGCRFEDVVAQTNYEIDIHSPDGKKSCDERKIDSYDIPYRCLVPKGIEGLLVSGKAISATHVAMSSLRVQPTCYALGQAAGIAAAISLDDKCSLSQIDISKLHKLMYNQGVEFNKGSV